jgi:signal peptidase II
LRIIFVTFGIILADQITKFLVKGISVPFLGINIAGLPLGTSIPIIGDAVRLTYIENAGMAFGIDVGGKLFFSVFSILASIGIFIYLYRVRKEHFSFRLSLAMILGGALGNLIDRIFYGVFYGDAPLFYGKVVDFIDADFFNISIFGYHLNRWPVFNIADASVTCGVILLLLTHRKTKRIEEGSPLTVKVPPTEGNSITPSESPGP